MWSALVSWISDVGWALRCGTPETRSSSGRRGGRERDLPHSAQERLGADALLHHHDLEEPLAFLADQSFDLVVMALVHHHVDARGQLLAEIQRVLRPGGILLISTPHPPA